MYVPILRTLKFGVLWPPNLSYSSDLVISGLKSTSLYFFKPSYPQKPSFLPITLYIINILMCSFYWLVLFLILIQSSLSPCNEYDLGKGYKRFKWTGAHFSKTPPPTLEKWTFRAIFFCLFPLFMYIGCHTAKI